MERPFRAAQERQRGFRHGNRSSGGAGEAQRSRMPRRGCHRQVTGGGQAKVARPSGPHRNVSEVSGMETGAVEVPRDYKQSLKYSNNGKQRIFRQRHRHRCRQKLRYRLYSKGMERCRDKNRYPEIHPDRQHGHVRGHPPAQENHGLRHSPGG